MFLHRSSPRCSALCLFIISLLFVTSTSASPPRTRSLPAAPTVAELRQQIGAILDRGICREGKTGVLIQDLRSGQVLIERNADTPMIPASNQKVLTTVGAFGILSPQYTFETSVRYSGTMKDGRVTGDLYLIGGGDPSLVKEEMWKIAERVGAMGIRSVSGDLVVDGHFFDGQGYPDEDWKRISMPLWYNAPTGGAAFNFNSISVIVAPGARPGDPARVSVDPPLEYFEVQNSAKTGPAKSKVSLVLDIADSDEKCLVVVKGKIPAQIKPQTYYRHLESADAYAGHSFRYYLEQTGVVVEGRVRQGKKPDKTAAVFQNQSAPLSELLRDANKVSNNFMMEQIAKTVGAETCDCAGSTRSGMQKIKDYFSSDVKLPTAGMVLSDGSGLSRLNRVTPRQMAGIIRWALNESTFGPEFLTCLPVAGVDGTMKRRLTKHPDKRLIRAKTGLINNVVCLSGVVDGRSGNGLVFSIFINQNKGRHGESKKAQDDILSSMLNYWVRHNRSNETSH